ncbi:MAG: hypothetical protein HY056_06865 [Proteobacteria bacterium]|nr:hypothetical protein [Pseudomonadota bacterium]
MTVEPQAAADPGDPAKVPAVDAFAGRPGDGAPTPPPPPAYAYRPSLMGAAMEFVLAAEALEWRSGRGSGRVRYADVTRIRLSFRPTTLQHYRFLAEIWSAGGPKLCVASCSWKSMVEQERLDAPYTAFIGELHRRMAAHNRAARFEYGSPPLLYWPGLALFVTVIVAMTVLVMRAARESGWKAAMVLGAFLAFFLWQAGTFFHRNRPGTYRPGDLPANVLPTKVLPANVPPSARR